MNRINKRWLIGIILLAIVLRIVAALYLGNAISGRQQNRIYDQVSYNALARSLLAGSGYSFDENWYPFTPAHTPTAHWSFLYPLYLASVYSISGYYPLVARLIQVLISGTLSVWLFFRLGRRLFGEKVGLVSALLGALYIYFIYHDAALMTESFFILGILAMLDVSLQIVEENDDLDEGGSVGVPARYGKKQVDWENWILLGIILGVTALLRQTVILWVPFLLVWILWAGRGKVPWFGPLIALGVMAVFILPWTVRNFRVYGEFLPLNSNAGYALYSANHPDQGTHFDQDYAAPLPPDLVGKGLNEAQWNTALTRLGLKFIVEDPRRYLLLSLDRVPILFNFWFSAESDLASNLMRVLSFGLYLPLFIYGLIVSLHNWKICSLFYLFALVYSLMHIMIWASIRYRLPIDAALIPFAALAAVDLIGKLRTWLSKVQKADHQDEARRQTQS